MLNRSSGPYYGKIIDSCVHYDSPVMDRTLNSLINSGEKENDFSVSGKMVRPLINPQQYLSSQNLLRRNLEDVLFLKNGDCDGRNPAPDFSGCFLHHIGRQYWFLMEKHGLLEGPLANTSICVMADYYQFFREFLMVMEMAGTFVLLCDSRSPTFLYKDRNSMRGLVPFLFSLIPERLHSNFKVLYIQELVESIRDSGNHEWVCEFERKYGLG